MVLGGGGAVGGTDLEVRRGVASEPVVIAGVGLGEEAVEHVRMAERLVQPSLFVRREIRELLEDDLGVRRVGRAAEPEQHVDLVERREVAGIRAAILL